MESPYDSDYEYDYARPRAVVFPPPPPTTNTLSSVDRARLVRSSKKIARILGATPHFVDSEGNARGNDDLFVPNPRSISRASVDSVDSVSSCSTTYTSTSHTSSSTSATSLSSSRSLNRQRKPLPLTPSESSWPARKPPMLRLSLGTPLESIPASPRTPGLTPAPAPPQKRTMASRHRRQPELDGSGSTIKVKSVEYDSPQSSPTTPSFVIPTVVATRRLKMDRLRRLLGEDVPVRLVFPRSTDSDSDSQSDPSSPSSSRTSDDSVSTPNTSPVSPISPLLDVDTPKTKTEEKPVPRVPRTPPRKKKITNARDSLIISSSPSKSPRASKTFVAPQASRPAPPPPTPSPPSSPNKKTSAPKANGMLAQRKPIPAAYKGPTPVTKSPRVYEHPPVVHHRSHSVSSTRKGLGLGVILEERAESEWFGSDDEGEEYEVITEAEVLGAVYGWGTGGVYLYGGPMGKGMGRGLARSYGNR